VLCDEAWRVDGSMSNAASPTAPGAASPAVASFSSSSSSSGLAGSRDDGAFSGGPLPSSAPAAATAPSTGSSNGINAGAAGTAAAAAAASSVGYTGSNSFGLASGADADVLQLDALLLRVQLNLRSLLLDLGRGRDVNIISEKVGTEQDTRFEDRSRLPLGELIPGGGLRG